MRRLADRPRPRRRRRRRPHRCRRATRAHLRRSAISHRQIPQPRARSASRAGHDMKDDLLIRQAATRDVDTIARNNTALARESEGKQLDAATTARAVLEDPSKGFYLVAERGGVAVGQLMITFEWSDWRNATFWWIHSVYVDPSARRTGVFRALYDSILSRAKSRGDVCDRM